MRALAELLADDGVKWVPAASAQVEIGAGEVAGGRVGALALRVQADGAAWHEQWLDLREFGEHVVDVALQDGPAGRNAAATAWWAVIRSSAATPAGACCAAPCSATAKLRGLGLQRRALGGGDPSIRSPTRSPQRATPAQPTSATLVDVRPGDGDVHLELDAPLRHFGSVAIAARGVAAGTRFELRRDRRSRAAAR